MTVRKKIIAGFLLVYFFGVLLACVGLYGISNVTELSRDQEELQSESAEVTKVLLAHYNWRHSLTEAVYNGSEFTGSLNPDTCALGTWRQSDAAKQLTDPILLGLLSKITAPHQEIHNEAGEALSLYKAGNTTQAVAYLQSEIMPRTAEVIDLLNQMNSRYVELLEEDSASIVSTGNSTTWTVIIALFVSLAIAIVLAYFIIHGIMKPIRQITQAAENIARGNLNVGVQYTVRDELGHMITAFNNIVEVTKKQVASTEQLAQGDLNAEFPIRCDEDIMNVVLDKMADSMSDLFSDISVQANQVSMGSSQIASSAQMLATGATEQASTISDLSSNVNNITQHIQESASLAKEAAELVSAIRKDAEQGTSQMDKMLVAVKDINVASGSISKVIKVIDDIAFQTNILALNAAVEAARAGQHGKGFAVVADEVRNLAAKSAEAAKETGILINNAMEQATYGERIAVETGASLTAIVQGVNDSSSLVHRIAVSATEQEQSFQAINQGLDHVSQVVQQNSAAAEENAAASEQMSNLANNLQNLMSQFKLRRK